MGRLRVALLFGGCSEERHISVKSAREVARSLDPDRYELTCVGITTRGEWRLCDGPSPDWENGNLGAAVLSPDRGTRGLLVLEGGRCETLRIDVVLPVLHGSLGEDGAVQGLLELSGVPYVGCDVQSSAVCMDKSLAYTVVRSAGIDTPTFWTVSPGEDVDPGRFPYPVFVKPARSGSSFGVSHVALADDLHDAIETAARYDSKVLVEEAVRGHEVGCGIVGDGANDLLVGEPDRVALSHGFFRIHQETQPEYGSENATFIVPADISTEARARVQATAQAVYRVLGCKGLARVDFFLTEDGSIVLNEVNTFPGMTSYSRFPRMMAAAGLPLSAVLDRLVSLALGENS